MGTRRPVHTGIRRVELEQDAVKSLLAGLFEAQREFVLDRSGRVAALCPRRSGKSYACCVRLIKTALETEFCTVVYITLTLQQATQNVWDGRSGLKHLNAKYGLGMKFNETKREALLPNGSMIRLIGAADRGAGEKLRGGQYALVIIDECKSFRPPILKELIDEVLTPALYDYVDPDGLPGGTLALIGTPGHILAGPFYEATTGADSRWSYHFWTVADNVAMPHIWEGMLRDHFPNGLEDAPPDKRREYLGEWAPSEELSVFYVSDLQEAPISSTDETVLGVFLGLGGSLGLVVAGYNYHEPTLQILYDYREYGLSLTDISKILRRVIKKYDPQISRVYTSELGSSLVDRLNLQYDLDLQLADGDDHALVELINTDLRDSCTLFYEGSNLVEEMKLLQWENEDRKKFNHDTDHQCCYAFMHVWQEAQHRFYTPAERVLTKKEQVHEAETASLERMARLRNDPLVDFGYGDVIGF